MQILQQTPWNSWSTGSWVNNFASKQLVVLHIPSEMKLLSGWWYTYPSDKYEFVSCQLGLWNSQYMEKIMFQTTNQINASDMSSTPRIYMDLT